MEGKKMEDDKFDMEQYEADLDAIIAEVIPGMDAPA
jgi:hypothetical protein